MLQGLDELEAIAAENGGIRQLLDETWRKVYQANCLRRLFTREEMRAACMYPSTLRCKQSCGDDARCHDRTSPCAGAVTCSTFLPRNASVKLPIMPGANAGERAH